MQTSTRSHVHTFTLISVLLLSACGGPDADGRRGNGLYEAENYEEASRAYQDGLASYEDDAQADVRAGLSNNLGMAQYRLEDYGAAYATFGTSMRYAATDAARARAAYNRGNTAFSAGDNRGAIEAYRQALLTQPDHQEAKFNYEFIKRQMQEQEEDQDDSQERPEPSDYAKQLRAQAEALVAKRRYRAAHDLMTEGLQTDPTVRAFEPFITRIGNVANIDETEIQP
ncbi:MAG: tetratricopeptide repeat protein [Rhodothermales bacterium]